MKIEYVCHACLMIDTGALKIITDPWFAGPAYCGQWHVFPKPINVDILDDADVILLSHGHEDHLHESSLLELDKSKIVYYPYLIHGGTIEYLESMGFNRVVEAHSYAIYKLDSQTSVCYITNENDSIIVIECNNQIIVNINDALHADPMYAIEFFTNLLNKRYSKIDILFCGFGGASYYPNVFSVPGKNDVEIGKLREQLFVDNFCKIVQRLQPEIAIPFAADFALLSPEQKWINDIRFPRAHIQSYYDKFFRDKQGRSTRICDMYPGDILDNGKIIEASPYRKCLKNSRLSHLIDEQYPEDISTFAVNSYISEDEVKKIEEGIVRNIEERSKQYDSNLLEKINFSIELLDMAHDNFFNVNFRNGKAQVSRASASESDCGLTIQTTSKILNYSFSSQWGGDAICIGYGCRIYISDKDIIASGHHLICVQLLTRYPKITHSFKHAPLRTIRVFMNNPGWRLRYKHRFLRRQVTDVVEGGHWLLLSKEQMCQRFHLENLGVQGDAERKESS